MNDSLLVCFCVLSVTVCMYFRVDRTGIIKKKLKFIEESVYCLFACVVFVVSVVIEFVCM